MYARYLDEASLWSKVCCELDVLSLYVLPPI